MDKKTLILVIGCHRSGTSAVAGALAHMGVDLGTNLLGVGPDNPKGFFEDRLVVAAHDLLLSSVEASWDRPPNGVEYPSELLAKVKWNLRSVLRDLSGPICAIKDPRATLFVDLWQEICRDEGVELRLLRVDRKREDVVASLRRREGWDDARALEISKAYENAAYHACSSVRFSRIVFPDQLWNGDNWRRIFNELEIPLEPDMTAIRGFLDKTLIHHPLAVKWTVIVPSRSDEKILEFAESIRKTHPQMFLGQMVVVSDGLSEDTRQKLTGVTWVEGKSPFVYSRAINMGVAAADSRSDLVVCGDDIRFPMMGLIQRLCEFSFGISAIAPEIFGVCGQAAQRSDSFVSRPDWLTFNCIYIPRRVWDAVGPMDERFVGYGYDDVDWCIRARQYGEFIVDHGSAVEHIESSSFRTEEGWQDRYVENEKLLKEKWDGEGSVVFG